MNFIKDELSLLEDKGQLRNIPCIEYKVNNYINIIIL